MSAWIEVCDLCCKWCAKMEGKAPAKVRDGYPSMMLVVLQRWFGISEEAAGWFIGDACKGNWERLHETDLEKTIGPKEIAEHLVNEVRYFSDRWSWDRVMRAQWLYMRLKGRLDEAAEG